MTLPLPPWIYPPVNYTPFQIASAVQPFVVSGVFEQFLQFRTAAARWTRIAYMSVFRFDLAFSRIRVIYPGGPTGDFALGVNDFFLSVPVWMVVEPGSDVEVLLQGTAPNPGQIILTGWEFVP